MPKPLPTIAAPTTAIAIPPTLQGLRGRQAGEFTDRLLDIKDVTAKTSISRSKLYQMMGDGRFPQSIHLAPQMTRWRESTIDAWMEALEAGAWSDRQ